MIFLAKSQKKPHGNAAAFDWRHKVACVVLFLVLGILASLCANEGEYKYENRYVAAALIHPKYKRQKKIRFTDIPGVDPTSIACVLEPYRDEIDSTEPFASAINRQLNI